MCLGFQALIPPEAFVLLAQTYVVGTSGDHDGNRDAKRERLFARGGEPVSTRR